MCWGTCVAMGMPCTCIAWRHFQVNGDRSAGWGRQTAKGEVTEKETRAGCEFGKDPVNPPTSFLLQLRSYKQMDGVGVGGRWESCSGFSEMQSSGRAEEGNLVRLLSYSEAFGESFSAGVCICDLKSPNSLFSA